MTELQKKRDELAERYVSLSEPELTRIHMKNDYKNGFDAAIEVLAKQSVEFDAVKAIVKMEASEGPADFERELSLLNLLKWQHQQTARIYEAKLQVAREGTIQILARATAKVLSPDETDILIEKIQAALLFEKLGGG